MAIGILETVAIHEAVVLGFVINTSTCSYGFSDEGVDFFAVHAGECDEDFGALGSVHDLVSLGHEALELLVRQQHGVDGFADDEAGRTGIGEALIKSITESAKEGHGLSEATDWKIEEDALIRHDEWM